MRDLSQESEQRSTGDTSPIRKETSNTGLSMPTHYCEDQDNVAVSQSEAREHNIKPKENENSFYPILPLSSKLDLDLNDDFHRACRDGYLEKVQEFIRRGASLNSRATATTLKSSDYTPLMRASVRGHSEVVMTLIDEGADIEAKDPNGFTALMLASRVGRTETVAILVDAGAKLEETVHYFVFVSEEATAYMLAKDRGHTKVMDILLSVGAIVRDCERKPHETKPEPAKTKLPRETNFEVRKSSNIMDGTNMTYYRESTFFFPCQTTLEVPPSDRIIKRFSYGAADHQEPNMNPQPGRTQDFHPGVFCFTQLNVSQFFPVHQPPADDVLTDPQLNKSKEWSKEMWKIPIRIKNTKNPSWKDQQSNTGFEKRPFTRNFYKDKQHGLSLLHFTLCEFVGMRRGSFPPLDFVTRIMSSKFWMLEADKWVDLLIICRWANPTIIKMKDVICWICGNEWIEPRNTSCGHTFCMDCLHGCQQCPIENCKAVIEAKVYPNESAKVILTRYHEERQKSYEQVPKVDDVLPSFLTWLADRGVPDRDVQTLTDEGFSTDQCFELLLPKDLAEMPFTKAGKRLLPTLITERKEAKELTSGCSESPLSKSQTSAYTSEATAAQLSQECSEEALLQLSTEIAGYNKYKHRLGIGRADLDEIDNDPRDFYSAQGKFYSALLKWKSNSIDFDNPSTSTATYGRLVEIAKEGMDGEAVRSIHKACIKHTMWFPFV